MDVKAAGAGAMGAVAQGYDLTEEPVPGHLLHVKVQAHGVGNQLKALT